MYLESNKESLKILKQESILNGFAPRQQWRGRTGNDDWPPEMHWRGFYYNMLLYLPPSLLSKFLRSGLLFYLQVLLPLNLASTSASFLKWPSPKSPMTFTEVAHSLSYIWLLWCINTIGISHLPENLFSLLLYPLRRIFLSADWLYAGKTVVNITKNAVSVAVSGQGSIGALSVAEDFI